jgi:hypothetical protein
LYAVARGANNNPKVPDLHKGNFDVTLGQVAFSALKVFYIYLINISICINLLLMQIKKRIWTIKNPLARLGKNDAPLVCMIHNV